jgi:hypothetical protein
MLPFDRLEVRGGEREGEGDGGRQEMLRESEAGERERGEGGGN